MPYLIGYLNVVIDAFIVETKHEELNDETFSLLTTYIVEKISHLKMSLAVDAIFELLKSLGTK
jgi:hypothetical protein